VRIFHAADFATRGSATIPNGDYIAVGIGPGSHMDMCAVGGSVLGPMSLVPLGQGGGANVTAIRGSRSGPLNTNDGVATPYAPDGTFGMLELLLYERCDPLVPPGPRAPIIKATQNGAFVGGGLALRMPFMGRKTCAIFAKQETGINSDFTVTIRGIRYFATPSMTAAQFAQHAINTEFPFAEEVVLGTYFKGGATRRLSTVGTDAPNYELGVAGYVGGNGDMAEAFDEIEIWTTAVGALFVQAEVYGERNQ